MRNPHPRGLPHGLCPACVLAGATTPQSTIASSTPPPSLEEIAAQFSGFELIGQGGMGAVYKVRQPQFDRIVALKILSHDLAHDPAFAERFNREARVLARLNHPNIVTIFDFGTQGPFCYLLMEYIDGINLRQAMAAGEVAPAETLDLVRDICGALQFAHEEGILHQPPGTISAPSEAGGPSIALRSSHPRPILYRLQTASRGLGDLKLLTPKANS